MPGAGKMRRKDLRIEEASALSLDYHPASVGKHLCTGFTNKSGIGNLASSELTTIMLSLKILEWESYENTNSSDL